MLNTTWRRGFTLVEMAIVGAILVGFVAILYLYVSDSNDSVLEGRDGLTQVLNSQLDATESFRLDCPTGPDERPFTAEELEAAGVICNAE